MKKYVLKRLLMMIPVILGVAILIFSLMFLTPGDPTTAILGSNAEPWEYEALREKLGLDQPYLVQLGNYLVKTFVHFDLGTSYASGASVTQEIIERLPRTLVLGFSSIIVSVCLGIPMGVNAAVHQNTWRDWLPLTIALIGVSMPGFWLALMLVILFSVQLGWLPAYGIGGIQYWILPILSTSFHGVATMARQTRSSMLDVLNSDYILMAKAKGMRQHDVIYKHALPNALIPIVQIIGSQLAHILGRGVLIETVFSIPGVGYYMVKAVKNGDYTAAEGSVLVIAIVFSLVMLLTDIVMAAINPRIKAQFIARSHKKSKKSIEKEAKAS